MRGDPEDARAWMAPDSVFQPLDSAFRLFTALPLPPDLGAGLRTYLLH